MKKSNMDLSRVFGESIMRKVMPVILEAQRQQLIFGVPLDDELIRKKCYAILGWDEDGNPSLSPSPASPQRR